MNVPYPGFSHESGVYVSVAVMIAAIITLWVVFRKRDWL
jgi:magnesium transporter